MELPSEIEQADQLTTIIDGSVDWSQEHEKILIEWADKAMCYRWLHSRANSLYSNLNAWYTIPVIVISTLTGTANFALTRVPIEYQNYFAMGVGAFNILGGIVTTIQQFLKITQLNESHRVSSIAWDKFYRNVKIELAKHPSERMHAVQMLKMCKEEFDRLMETSPVIPDKIISSFKNSFKNSDAFEKIVKPEICDSLVSTEFSRNQWFNDENREKRMSEAVKVQLAKENQQKHAKEMNLLMLRDFKRTFFNLNNREAMKEEIIDNLKDKIDEELLIKLIEEFESEEIV
uniref:SMODS and SLOG-associating 2TM effector domain-containing protein n=1 Tax=viral metagenome TaxID=1070528 RepID=A0A6C0LDJ8_9ZZZZ